MKTKVLFLVSAMPKALTGGVIYDSAIRDILSADPRFELEYLVTDNISGTGIRRTISRHTAWIRNLRLYKKCRTFDWVIVNSVDSLFFTPLAWMLRHSGTRVIAMNHLFEFHNHSGLRRKYVKMLEKSLLRVAQPVVVSPYMLDLCRKYFPGKEIFYWQIPFGQPETTLQPAPRPGHLLFVGNIAPRKGLIYLVQAMALLRQRGIDVTLTVLGKPLDRKYCAQVNDIITRNQLSVTFTGFIIGEEKDRIIAESDIFAFPSLNEGYGMVICETMRRGLPSVVFDNSAMPYTVNDGVNGLVVPTADVKAYADAIGRIVTDRQLRSRLSAGALATRFVTPDEHRARVTADLLDNRRPL